ncbi:MAG TPA: nitrilase-related carbon-nitrogen hydrolase [Chthonomonadaceae bacterium]|nr:nitrilase-related carbon-nitrogen hydrolase [Chthonomonadaceae bacterium]
MLLSLGAGGVLALCFPPVGLSFLQPLCLAALIFLLQGVTVRQAFYIGVAFGMAAYGGGLFWLSNLFGVAAISLCAILSLFPALFAALLVWMQRRLPGVPVWLLAAFLWTGVEYYRSELFVLNFGWMGLGYGVVNTPVLAAFASVFGSYGLTFVIVALGALLAMSIQHSTIRAWGLYGLWLVLFVIPLPPSHPEHPLHVRLVQAISEDDQSYFSLSCPSPGHPVDVIVWPEYSFVSDPTRQPALWQKLTGLARQDRAYLLFGAKDQFDPTDEAGFRNTAYLIGPDGRLVGRHVKNHPVHFIRDGVAGTDSRAIPTPLGRLGVAICFDMDYPDVARRLAADGAAVFLVPNDDPPEWGPVQRAQHRLMFQMRAAECGRWLARADVAGGTSIVAPTGQEVAHVQTLEPTMLEASVGRNQDRTLFVRGGWLFGPFCLFATLALWLWLFLRNGFHLSKALNRASFGR